MTDRCYECGMPRDVPHTDVTHPYREHPDAAIKAIRDRYVKGFGDIEQAAADVGELLSLVEGAGRDKRLLARHGLILVEAAGELRLVDPYESLR